MKNARLVLGVECSSGSRHMSCDSISMPNRKDILKNVRTCANIGDIAILSTTEFGIIVACLRVCRDGRG